MGWVRDASRRREQGNLSASADNPDMNSHRVNQQFNRLAIASLLLLLVFAVVFSAISWRSVMDDEVRDLESVLVLTQKSLVLYFENKEAGLSTLAHEVDDARGLEDLTRAQRLLNRFKEANPELIAVNLVNPQGQFLATTSTASLSGLPNAGNEPSFQDFVEHIKPDTTVDVSRPQLGVLSKKWSFGMRYVLRGRDGQPKAFLVAVLPVELLPTFWRDAPVIEKVAVGLIRDDGYLLSRYPIGTGVSLVDVFGKPRTGALLQHLIQRKFPPAGYVEGYAELSGSDVVNVYQRVGHYPLTLVASTSFVHIREIWWQRVRVLLMLLVFLSIGGWWAFRLTMSQQLKREIERRKAEEALATKEEEQRFLIDHLMAGLVVHGPDGAVLRCNLQATQLLGLSFEQMIGAELTDPRWRFVREDGSDMPVSLYPVSRVLATGAAVSNLVVGVVKSDAPETTWLLGRADPAYNSDGSIRQIVVTFVDISLLRKYQFDLERTAQRFKALFDNSMDAVFQTRLDGSVLAANPAACKMFGRTEAQIKAMGRAALVDVNDQRLGPLLSQRAATGRAAGELRMLRGDGTSFEAEVSSNVYEDEDHQLTSSMIVRDISARLRDQQALEAASQEMLLANQQLAEIAHYDALTHLPNRALMADRLQQAMSQSNRRQKLLAVAFLDLDGFKLVNDQYGHATGDQLLITISQRLKSALREGDTLARIGGDEFVVVMVDLEQMQDCEPLLLRLLKVSSEPVVVDDVMLQVSASIGVTFYPADNVDADKLIRHADQAMYLAKQVGKNRYHIFDIAHDEAIKTQLEGVEQIRRALDQREFVLFYQPKVNMKSGEVIGAEALIRWQHPQRGLLAPGSFLPMTEDHLISVELGEWVIDTALGQIEQWHEAGLKIPISVNVGALQLQHGDFSACLSELLARHPKVKPNDLELEILETSALIDITQVSNLMKACQKLGVRFALDDFGTGYSSLIYLKRLPAELLKIDQGFIRDMLEDPDDLAIVQGVIGLAKAFRREVIAEGVETIEHGALLLSLGCEQAQGYGIARPMPAGELPAWMASWRPDAAWRNA